MSALRKLAYLTAITWMAGLVISACNIHPPKAIIGKWCSETFVDGRYPMLYFKEDGRSGSGSVVATSQEDINVHRSSYLLTHDSLIMFFEPDASRSAFAFEFVSEGELVLQNDSISLRLKRCS